MFVCAVAKIISKTGVLHRASERKSKVGLWQSNKGTVEIIILYTNSIENTVS